ncbi:3-hydroxyacyl-CoA dehydrogenase NAD-binding domain-containing protein [Nocardioides sp.]|uniref:3-hydroxyacyl-CoA dehydrogenase NAD-binding domain-containing protein n=1 Tax=Nocardioides sp. TaxID=35761 RepID=UPI0035159E8B
MSIAIVGAGVIGRGWVAHLVARGHDVTVYDPHTEAGVVHEAVAEAAPALHALGFDEAGFGRVEVVDDLAAAVAGATWVQESGPETASVKAAVMAALDELADPAVPIASSTSGITPTELGALCPRAPERVLVGHPFNPVYLVPLVEVVGGRATSPAVVEQALEFYRAVGKRPVHVRQEVPGHLANRLQAALWREAYSLVERGVASVADIDTAIAHGPGLRWALLGPLVNQHLSGGAGGLRHILEHLGPPTQMWMDSLGAPQLTPALADLLVAGVDDELAGIDQHELRRQRDELLVRLLLAKSDADALP